MSSRTRQIVKDTLQIGAFALLMLASRSTIADHYKIPSGSMEFTLLPGDRILVDKLAYGIRVPFTNIELSDGSPPQPGELVIFDSPADGTRLIKRVVGVSGDLVELRKGHLIVNGESVPSEGNVELFGERAAHLNLDHGGGPDLGPLEVPEDSVLVLGDSRGNSRDSRYFGFVAESEIYGRAVRLYFRRGEGLSWQRL